MLRKIKLMLAMMVSSLLVLSLGWNTALAGSLQDLRASGALGEAASGYVVAREANATAEANAINQKRKVVYSKKATTQGASIEQVGQIYAREIVNQVPAGTWIQNQAGKWLKK